MASLPELRDRLASLSGLGNPTRLTSLENARTTPARTAPGEPFRRSLPKPDAPGAQTVQRFPLHTLPGLQQLAKAGGEAARTVLREPDLDVPPPEEWVFLDTETTGLAGGTGTYVFLVGLGRLTAEGFLVEQFFLHDLATERDFLSALSEPLEDASVVITYNGNLFDLPLLETRFRLARHRLPRANQVHLDLLYPARVLWRLRVGSARLVELERHVLGFERMGDVPGALIPGLYFDFLRTGNVAPLAPVIRHNAWDVASLAALTGLLLDAVAAPETFTGNALELYGLSRLLEKAGQPRHACFLYERALRQGLPGELEHLARRNLALLYKRERAYGRAVALWQQLADAQADSLAAYEELAICYEHRLGDLHQALETTERALRCLDRLSALESLRADSLVTTAPSGEDGAERYRRLRARFHRRRARLSRKRARVVALPARARGASASLGGYLPRPNLSLLDARRGEVKELFEDQPA